VASLWQSPALLDAAENARRKKTSFYNIDCSKKTNPPRRPASCTFGKLDVLDQDMAAFVKANFLDPKQGKLN
jgi:hypothetical protein